MEKSKESLCKMVLDTWSVNEAVGDSVEGDYKKDSFIYRMMEKKFKVMGIDIELPEELVILIEICSDGNPGVSQLMLKQILDKKVPGNGDRIYSEDFQNTFGEEFPIVEEGNKYYKMYGELWEKQKTENRDNLVDTYEYWKDTFKK